MAEADPSNPGPDPNPHPPRLPLPAGACDSHCHIFGPRSKFPYAARRRFTPPEAPKEDLRRLHDLLGFDRAVIVQSDTHGGDHSAVVDALVAGAGRYRGVALIGPDTPDAELSRLHAAGVRGVRVHFATHLGSPPSPEWINAVAEQAAAFSWHVSFHFAGMDLADYESLLSSVRATVVIDHMGRVDLRSGVDTPPVRTMLRLLDSGSVWVKLSGADRLATAPPDLRDAAGLARRLAAHAPDRVVWGTDFPHVNVHGFTPNDGDLVDLIELIVDDEPARRKLLVTNPETLFDFPAWRAG